MRRVHTLIAICAAAACVAISLPGPAAATDVDALGRIRDEGFHRSQVMALLEAGASRVPRCA